MAEEGGNKALVIQAICAGQIMIKHVVQGESVAGKEHILGSRDERLTLRGAALFYS